MVKGEGVKGEGTGVFCQVENPSGRSLRCLRNWGGTKSSNSCFRRKRWLTPVAFALAQERGRGMGILPMLDFHNRFWRNGAAHPIVLPTGSFGNVHNKRGSSYVGGAKPRRRVCSVMVRGRTNCSR